MATGDKRPVVMEEDLGAPGGVATLDADGKLLPAQRPSATDMGAADLTLSNLSDPAAAIYNLGAKPGENLIIDWYFPAASVIDQRKGYVVPPNTPYYSDTGLTTQAGAVSAYTTAVYADGVYGAVTVDSTTYYVDWSAAVRGYLNSQYGIDRWVNGTTFGAALIEEDGLRLIPAGSGTSHFMHRIEPQKMVAGQQYTFSLFTGSDLWYGTFTAPEEGAGVVYPFTSAQFAGDVSCYFANQGVFWQATIVPVIGRTPKIMAAKLELGGVSTLAYQDADGNWVLNDPPPDYGTELAKCQRYQIEMNPHGKAGASIGWVMGRGGTISYGTVNLPVQLRAVPTAIMTGGWALYDIRSAGNPRIPVTKISVNTANSAAGELFLGISTETATEAGVMYLLAANVDASARLLFDANL